MTQSLVHTDPHPSLHLLSKAIYELQAATDLTTLTQVVTSYVHHQLGYELVWLGLYSAQDETLKGPYLQGCDGRIDSVSLQVLPGDLFDQVLLTRQPATVVSLQEESRVGSWQQIAQELKIQGAVLHSIRYRKESLGVLVIGTSKWGINPRRDESDQLKILANTLGSTVQSLQANLPETSAIQPSPDRESPSFASLLQTLTQCHSWEAKLTCISQSVRPLAPISGLYLLDTAGGDFSCLHLHDSQKPRNFRSRKPKHTLSFHQNLSFFRALERQPPIGVGDITSNIGTSVPNTLTTFLGARALLLQPIVVQQSLKGFWVLGDAEPTQWSQSAKELLAKFANLVELMYPPVQHPSEDSSPLGESLSRLSACVLPSPLADQEDWEKGLNNWFRSLTQQFQCQWSILLTYDVTAACYLPTQYFSAHRRAGFDQSTCFGTLSPVDEKLIMRQESAVDLRDLQEDMRLLAWRDQLLSQGIQSILVSRLSPGSSIEQLLLLGTTSVRGWKSEEAKDLQVLACNLNQAQQRRKLHVEMLDERRLNQGFRQGLQIMQRANSSRSFVEQSIRVLADLFGVLGCGILLWPPQRKFAKVKASISPGVERFSVPVGTKVDLSDPLIQQLLKPAYDAHPRLNPVTLSGSSLSEATQRWLSVQEDWSIVGLPLQPQPKKPVFGVLLMASPNPIELTDAERETLSDFARYMAWILCSSHMIDAWRKDYADLHTAHWYHNKVLGHSFEQILQRCQALREASTVNPLSPHQAVETVTVLEQSVTDLYDQNAKLIPPVQFEMESIILVRLLREVLDRLDVAFAAKQIWVQVHHLKQSNVALNSSKIHLIYVLDEVLKAATVRSEVGGRIDVWCQMNHPEWLDLSITDNGQLDPRFLKDLNLGHQRDRLKPSLVTEDIGQRLLACQTLIQAMGGKLEFRTLEDQRTLTRFTLPCVVNSP